MATVLKENNKIAYFSGIDVLRFLAALMIILHHATLQLQNKGFSTKAELIFRNASFFLDLFFVISGFLISLILIKEREFKTFSLKNFYVRRIIRIWPLYFLIVFVKILILPLIDQISWEYIGPNLLYACTFSVNYQLLFSSISPEYSILWSVCIEEHIYLLLPLFIFIFRGRFMILGWTLLVGGFLSWYFFSGVKSPYGYSTPYFISTSYFYFFGLGAVIAYFHNAGVKLKFIFAPLAQIIMLILTAAVVFNFIPYPVPLGKSLLLNGILCSYLVWAGAQKNFVISFNTNISKYLGNVSYGMYMIHVMISSFIVNVFMNSSLQFSELLCGWGIPFVVAGISIGTATLLYYFFERPILKLKKKFTTIASK